MSHYKYTEQLQAVWQKAVKQYEAGQRDSATYFSADEEAFLASIGTTAQEIYDFAEDYVSGGEPDFATMAVIHDIRRSYFLEVQKSQPSDQTKDPATYPPKDSEVAGIVWLPRILEKAKAKLRGELDADTMYSCGGDRKFLRENDIHAGEFLRKVWENIDNDQAVIDWVSSRRPAAATA